MNAVTLADAMQYFAYSQALTVNGGTGPFTWSVVTGSLPTGLALNASTGVISGTPIATGTLNFTIQVADANSATNTQALSISVYPPDCTGTPEGNTVKIRPHYEVGLTFEQVTASGITCADRLALAGLGQPAGYVFSAPEPDYLITTEANYFNYIEVCLDYNPNYFNSLSTIRLFHFDGSSWIDVTTSVDTQNNVICGLTPSFSPFAIGEEVPTAITLSDFQARKIDGQLVINWTTQSEIDNWGFRLLRSETAAGPFVPVTQTLIPARGGVGLTMSYSFVDSSADINKTYYYQLEDFSTRGLATLHDVVAVRDTSSLNTSVAESSKSSTTSVSGSKAAGKSTGTVNASSPDAGVTVLFPETPASNTDTAAAQTLDDSGNNLSGNYQNNAGPVAEEQTPAADVNPASRMAVVNTGGYHSSPAPMNDMPADIDADTPSMAFRVSIKDAQGHVINVSRGAGPESGKAIEPTDITVLSENGRTEVSWQVASKQVRGFVLHRRKIGEADYQSVVKYIPNYGDSDTAIYNYKFIDNDNNDGRTYQYRLEVLNWGIQTARHE